MGLKPRPAGESALSVGIPHYIQDAEVAGAKLKHRWLDREPDRVVSAESDPWGQTLQHDKQRHRRAVCGSCRMDCLASVAAHQRAAPFRYGRSNLGWTRRL